MNMFRLPTNIQVVGLGVAACYGGDLEVEPEIEVTGRVLCMLLYQEIDQWKKTKLIPKKTSHILSSCSVLQVHHHLTKMKVFFFQCFGSVVHVFELLEWVLSCLWCVIRAASLIPATQKEKLHLLHRLLHGDNTTLLALRFSQSTQKLVNVENCAFQGQNNCCMLTSNLVASS